MGYLDAETISNHTEPMAYVAPSLFYTEPSRWFMEQLLELVPGTQNGGIYANKPGYHNTRNQNLPTNYSVVLPPDKLGPGTKAAGYDWTFPEAQMGDYSRISVYSSRLRDAGQANDPRTDGWREFYGQADLDTQVEGWDFYYNRAASSDSSHLWHIHLSELREFTDDPRNKQAMLSILKGESLEDWLNGGDDMTPEEKRVFDNLANAISGWMVGLDEVNQTFPDGSVSSVKIDGIYKATAALVECGDGGSGGLTEDETRAIVREELDKTKLST